MAQAQTVVPVLLPSRDRRNTLKSDFDKVKAMSMGRTRQGVQRNSNRTRRGTWVPKNQSSPSVARNRSKTSSGSNIALQVPSNPADLANKPTTPNKKQRNRNRKFTTSGPVNPKIVSLKDTRTRSFTIGTSSNKSPEFTNPAFVKELEELRDILRTSQLKQKEPEKEEISSLEEAQRTIDLLRSSLQDLQQQHEKLTAELRIERNLRLDLEKVNKKQAEQIEQLVAGKSQMDES